MLQVQCERHNCGVILDVSCDLTYPLTAAGRAEIEHLKSMIDKAVLLGCATVRITLGGQTVSIQRLARRVRSHKTSTRNSLKSFLASAIMRRSGYLFRAFFSNFLPFNQAKVNQAIVHLKGVLPYAQRYGVSLAIENHWGISSRPEWILQVVEAVDSDRVGTCPDFANFPTSIDRYAALAALAPRALHVQAKCWHFQANGEESRIDFRRCIQILRQVGYERTIAIEYEGGGDEFKACLQALQLVQRNL